MQLAIKSPECEEAGEGQLALWAPGLLLVDSPMQEAASCSRFHQLCQAGLQTRFRDSGYGLAEKRLFFIVEIW